MTNLRIVYTFIAILFSAIFFSGCMTKQDYTLAGGKKVDINASTDFEPYRIKKGDRLSIIVAKHPEISTRSDLVPPSSDIGYLVTSNGTITVPLIGHVAVEDLSICETTILITKLIQQYVKNPQVAVDLVNPKIFIVGEVNKPGAVRVDKNIISLMEAIAYAEDFNAYADRSSIKIIRGNPKNPEVYEIDGTKMASIQHAPIIYPNDIIYVEPSGLKAINLNIAQILFSLTGSFYHLDAVTVRKIRL